jgi:flagellar hook protein FlgE
MNAGVETNFSEGAAQLTGRSTDLMINGDGFFVVRDRQTSEFTRNGSFSFDTTGLLTSNSGAVVQGWMATKGVLNSNAAPGDIKLPVGTQIPPVATVKVTMGGNLPADSTTAATNPITTTITGYDAQGNPISMQAKFTKIDSINWTVDINDGTAWTGAQALAFQPDGTAPTPSTLTGSNGIIFDMSGVTSFAAPSTVAATAQDGSAQGNLESFTITSDGILVGVFSNGNKQPLAQIALANFANPPGLEKMGDSMYQQSANSGVPIVGVASVGGRGSVQGGALEMSNVDLAEQFTNLVIAQRGFQANSKVITTSDEMLQDLVNLKR